MLQHGVSYYVTVTAVNIIGMETSGFSDVIGLDLTPPASGKVVDLHSVFRIDVTNSTATVVMNKKICTTDEGRVLCTQCDMLWLLYFNF